MSALEKRCAVCGLAGAVAQTSLGGTHYGFACPTDGKCRALLWEAWFNTESKADAHEHEMTLWQWRHHRNAKAGLPCTMPAPLSEGEQLGERQQLEHLGRLPEGYLS